MDKRTWREYEKTLEVYAELKKLVGENFSEVLNTARYKLKYSQEDLLRTIRDFRSNIKEREISHRVIDTFYSYKAQKILPLAYKFFELERGYYNFYRSNVKIEQVKQSLFDVKYAMKTKFSILADGHWEKFYKIPLCIGLGGKTSLITHCKPIQLDIDGNGIDLYHCTVEHPDLDKNTFHKYVAINAEHKFFAHSKQPKSAVKNVQTKISKFVMKKMED